MYDHSCQLAYLGIPSAIDRQKVSKQTYMWAWFQHIVSFKAGDRHEGHGLWVIANFLDVSADFLYNLLVACLAVGGFSGIYFVDTNNELLHSQSVCK